ncbi:MAG: hypothetical protein U0T73_08975 [Chitinophagales bacterium]
MQETNKKFENAHIAIWLVKDTCWCLSFKTLAVGMIAPTLAVALLIVWQTRKDRADLFHNIAVALWITANSIWMIGELYFDDTFRPYALVFFGLGLIVVAWYYLVARNQKQPL